MVGIIPYVIGILAQFSVAFGLWRWGCAIARSRPGAFWRWLARAPIVALALSMVGASVAAFYVSRAFLDASQSEPSMKATVVARGISIAMSFTAFFSLPAIALYVVCAVIFFMSSIRD